MVTSMPWLWLPALILLTVDVPAFAGVRLSPAALLLPLAAWLGVRFGRRGIAVVLLSGPLVVPHFSFAYASLGGAIGWWLGAIAIAIVAASPLPVAERLTPVRDRPHLFATFLFVIVLPVSFDLDFEALAGDFPVTLRASLWPTFYLLLFLLGARRAPWTLALASIAATLAGGWLFVLAGLNDPWGDWSWLRYGMIAPASVTAAVACFAVGRAVHGDLYGRRPDPFFGRWPIAAVGALLLLWAVPDSLSAVRLHVDGVRWLHLFGSYYLLPLAAFLAGWSRGATGVRFVAGSTIVLILLRHLADYFMEGSILLTFNVEWLFIPYLYGAFGIAARFGMEAAAATVAWRRDAFLFSAIMVTPLLFQPDTPEGAAGAVAFLLIVTAMALAAAWIGSRGSRLGLNLHPNRWLGAAVALLVLASMARYVESLLAALRQALPVVAAMLGSLAQGETAWEEEAWWMMAFTAAMVVALCLSALAVARSLPSILADLAKLRAAFRYNRGLTRTRRETRT